MLASGHDVSVAGISSQQLGLPAQDHAGQNSSMDQGDFPEAPHLLAVDGCWGSEGHSLQGIWLLACCSWPRRWPHTHIHMGSTNWTLSY